MIVAVPGMGLSYATKAKGEWEAKCMRIDGLAGTYALTSARDGPKPVTPPQPACPMSARDATLPPRPDRPLPSLYFRHCPGSELLPNSVPTFDTYRGVDCPAI